MMAIRRPGVFTAEQQQLVHTKLAALANEWAQAWLPGDVDMQLSVNQQLFAQLPVNTKGSPRDGCQWLVADAAVQVDALRGYLCQLAAVKPARLSKDPKAQNTTEQFALAMCNDWLQRFVPVKLDEQQVVIEIALKLNAIHFVFRLHEKQVQALLPATPVKTLPDFRLIDALHQQLVTFPLTVKSPLMAISDIKALKPGMVLPLAQSLDDTWKLQLPGLALEGYLVAAGDEKALYLEQIQKVNK